jgi:uncharacterized protein (TIGR02145 family)
MIHKSLKVPIRCAIPVFSKSGAAPEPPRPVSLVMYGRLYSSAAFLNKVLITDFNVPSLVDFQTLDSYVNSIHGNIVGKVLKHCRHTSTPLGEPCQTSDHPRWTTHGSVHGLNSKFFSALPAGYGSTSKVSYELGTHCHLYSRSPSDTRYHKFYLQNTYDIAYFSTSHANTFNSIRLVRSASAEEQLLSDGSLVGYAYDFNLNQYDLVKIGTQIWTVQNFAGTKYTNGNSISSSYYMSPNSDNNMIFFANEEASIWKYE